MNLRTHKQMRLRQQSYILVNAYWQRVIDKALDAAMQLTPAEKEAEKARNEKLWADLWGSLDKNMAKRQLVEEGFRGPDESLEHDVDAFATANALFVAPKLYTVAKKSTGEVVATDLELGDAEEMILKAHKNKKAALVLA